MPRGIVVLIYSKKKVLGSRGIELLLSAFGPFLLPRRKNIETLPDDPTVVLIEPFQMGDVLSLAVMIQPILERFPRARIIIWCHTKNAHVYASDERIWKVVHAPFPWSNRGSKRGNAADWKLVLQSCREMRSYQPDVAIDTRGDIRSQIVMFLAGCDCRIAYTTYVGSNLHLRGLLIGHPLGDPPFQHRYRTNLYTLGPLLGSVPALHLPALFGPVDVTPEHNDPKLRTVLVHPGGGWIYKRWPQDRWPALIAKLQQIPSLRLIMVAGPGELELAQEIGSSLDTPVDIRSTSYKELLSLIAQASLFIGLDSGPMNAAVLLNVPVVALFGPGESNVWQPLSDRSRYFHHVENYPCHPCTQGTCVRPDDSCMKTIQIEEVFQAAQAILAGEPVLLPIL